MRGRICLQNKGIVSHVQTMQTVPLHRVHSKQPCHCETTASECGRLLQLHKIHLVPLVPWECDSYCCPYHRSKRFTVVTGNHNGSACHLIKHSPDYWLYINLQLYNLTSFSWEQGPSCYPSLPNLCSFRKYCSIKVTRNFNIFLMGARQISHQEKRGVH